MTNTNSIAPTWEQRVLISLHQLGGEARLRDLYRQIKWDSLDAGLPLSRTYEATVRRTCQQSSMIMQDVPGSGIWRLAPEIGAAERT